MTEKTSAILRNAALTFLIGPLCLGYARPVQAGSALCLATVTPPPTIIPNGEGGFRVVTPAPQSGFRLENGKCTNDLAGFSGAALASQALSDLSQSTTQETSRTTLSSISKRREQEEQRCAEGFSRVDGVCERIKPRVSEAEQVAPPPAAPAEKPAPKKTKKAKAISVSHPHAPKAPRPAPEIARRAPPPPPPPPPPLLPIEPAIRYGAWTQVYGDYEKRDANGFASIWSFSGAGSLVPLDLNVQSRTGTVGFQVGADATSRGLLFAGDGIIAGGFAGYVSSNVTVNATSLSGNTALSGNGFANVNARLTGPTLGLYATYFNGGFSTDFLLKSDILTLNESINQNIGFVPGPRDIAQGIMNPFNDGGFSSSTASLVNTTVAANLNYRFDLYPNLWVEPTVGAQYTNSTYGSGAAQLGLEDGALVMVQGGARFGTSTLLYNSVLMTTTLTGLAYDDVLVKGGFIPGAGFAGNNILAQADQGQVRGRGVVALNFDFGQGVTSFVQGEVRGGQGLFGAGGKAGVRVQW